MARAFVGFGFGPIQAGLFLAEARRSGNFDRLVVAEVIPDLVEAVRTCDGFMVNIATNDGIETERIEGVDIYNPTIAQDARHLIDAIAEATAICTALPSPTSYRAGSPSVADLLSKGFKARLDRGVTEPCVIYTAENCNDAAEQLQQAIAERMDDDTARCVKSHCRILNTVIGKMCQVLTDAESIDEKKLARIVPNLDRAFLVEAFNRILVDSCDLTPPPVGISIFVDKQNLEPFEEAKLYGHNAAHALIGYLAQEKGIDTMPEALEDPELLKTSRDAYLHESGAALIAKYAGIDPLFTPEGFRDHVDDLLERMASPYLDDSVARIVRDPARKLGWNDRLVGTMRIALRAGINPSRFAKAAAAALRMRAPTTTTETVGTTLRSLWGTAPVTTAETDAVIACVTKAFETGSHSLPDLNGRKPEAVAVGADLDINHGVVAASPKPLSSDTQEVHSTPAGVAASEKQQLLGPLFIGLDLGSTAIKGAITDADGFILAESVVETHLQNPQMDWVELDPEQHYRAVCEVIRCLTTAVPGEVAALAMAAAAGNTLLSDAAGKPLRPIISWMDGRTAFAPPKAIADLSPVDLSRVTGWPCLDSFPLAHLAWLREHDPDCLNAAAHIGMDTDWLLHRLTGQWRMDTSTAASFHLVDQIAGTYHAPLLKRLGIAQSKLSALVDSGTCVGPLTPQAARDTGLSTTTIAVAGSFDHPAAARAAGVTEPGQLMLSCGTSWVGLLPHANRDLILEAGLLCDPFLSAQGGPWAGMFSVPRIGRVIDWYIANAIAPNYSDPLDAFNALAAQSSGADGLTIDLLESPCIPDAAPADIARAVMEAAARLIHEKLQELAGHGLTFDGAVMVGGASRSPIWPGIVTTVTGLNMTVAGRSAGARGAALLAADGIKSTDNPQSELRHELHA